jgi:two-component system cell cycle sensor histidine kinase/response regulator CckA
MSEESKAQVALDTSVGQVPMDRLRSIFDGMFDGVWLVAADGRTTYANEAIARLLGTSPAAMRGRPLTEFVDEKRWPEVDSFLARQLVHPGERIALTFRRADGTDLFALVAGSPLSTAEGGYVGTMLNVSDVTGKNAMDAQLAQSQRLEAIGEFAAGIAHDFNNLLTSIRGHSELALLEVNEGHPVRIDLDQVITNVERGSAITRKLLAFTRQQVMVPMDLDPAGLIRNLLPVLKPLLNDSIEIVLAMDHPHDWIRVDPGQLEQVLVNLAINARDAMPTGGSLTITVKNLEPSDPERPDADLTGGPFVRISLADTGTGMDEATRTRIFDPFFTTKELGKGTGLGLATVFGIVAQSGGQIQVDTVPGRGTTFHVDLPRVHANREARPVATSIVPPDRAEDMARRLGTVLLVEDEPAVRELTRRALERAGYKVLAAENADDAMQASQRWPEAIDVVLTDVTMPGLHGPQLVELIRARRPEIGVVFMSGYADNELRSSGILPSTGAFLPKPFSIASLVRTVAEAMPNPAD